MVVKDAELKKRLGKPLVSVVTPFRDNVEQVRTCVNSLKRQPYKKIEIILVSDRMKWEDKDRRVKSVYDQNFKGAGEKRNAGVKYAKGGILLFLDSDCTVKPDAITKLVQLFNDIDTDAISGKPLAPEKGNLLGIATGLEYEDCFNRMGENYVSIAATTCFAVRRDAFKAVGRFKDYSLREATGEDWDFSRKFTASGHRIFHTNKMQVYHNHASDTIKKWFERRVEHSEYRVTHHREHGQVFEQYFSPDMFIDTAILLSIPVVLRMYKKSKRVEVFALPLFAILRNIAWFAGIIKGLLTRRTGL